jgi:hypothetical protein
MSTEKHIVKSINKGIVIDLDIHFFQMDYLLSRVAHIYRVAQKSLGTTGYI